MARTLLVAFSTSAVVVLAIVCQLSCVRSPSRATSTSKVDTAPIEQLPFTRALERSIREVRTRYPHVNELLAKNRFKLIASRNDAEQEWNFTFKWIPEASGSEAFVTVADNGKVEVLDGL